MPAPIYYTREAVTKFINSRFPNKDWTETISKLPVIIFRSKWNNYNLPYKKNYITELDRYNRGPKSFMSQKDLL